MGSPTEYERKISACVGHLVSIIMDNLAEKKSVEEQRGYLLHEIDTFRLFSDYLIGSEYDAANSVLARLVAEYHVKFGEKYKDADERRVDCFANVVHRFLARSAEKAEAEARK